METRPSTSFALLGTSYYVVDYYLSSATAVDQNATDDNMLLFLHYVFFAPLFQCGPLVRGGFDVFSKRIKSSPWTRRFNANKRSMTKRVVAIHERRVGFVRMVSYFKFLGNESNDIVCTTHVFTKSSLSKK